MEKGNRSKILTEMCVAGSLLELGMASTLLQVRFVDATLAMLRGSLRHRACLARRNVKG